ncbi:DNA replication licensing factor MCM5 [Galdieria sulphuraria]|uniref:DNA replication licensing factor MCM5 n=1 Tax=Galdieria sulphuraria TaxID=130081 RepID=M2XST7_GALSU|nr:minichromosome maintenance family (MCM) [Galdieria sulphuraria]EME26479.1 minichromosome maintenance family (MCM) [Galdieria sulphuraria]GJD10007.1 DNA replication licensing factor MCM5 [Galdieria sulphuraria]|eukprot:XP_005702999.1 minichromosome maintenance family (MCM) [Galdieria sulphuraria]
MTEWDAQPVYYGAPTFQNNEKSIPELSRYAAKEKFREFFLHYTSNESCFKYRERLQRAINSGDNLLELFLDDLHRFDDDIANLVRTHPEDYLYLMERTAEEAAQHICSVDALQDRTPKAQLQVILSSSEKPMAIRQINATNIGKLTCIRGIVISSSRVRAKATTITICCKNCQVKKNISVKPGLGGFSIPRTCDSPVVEGMEPCPLDPFVIVPDECEYADQQSLKLQELPEEVPTGEMPRSIQLVVDRKLVGVAVPGTRICVLGIYSISSSAPSGTSISGTLNTSMVRNPYLRVVGMSMEGTDPLYRFTTNSGVTGDDISLLQHDDEELMIRISRMPNLYSIIANSIAPEIYGHEDIKKAIACLLFAGSTKHLPDGMRIRGDINVLLLGDPSTAKSQLLKFVEKVAPISVYTSGKGSSAAGLTASVIRDAASGEFHLEGGAMVLADGGVVCIDEFDKMRLADRVAIHEAMEQQTISIAKAGITTVLNSRAAVLAAANPAFGRYDDTRAASENIEFQSTILSRFDLIFIVRDIRTDSRDSSIAKHVIGLHRQGQDTGLLGSSSLQGSPEDQIMIRESAFEAGRIDMRTLRRFIAYARSRCSPRLTPEAAELLKNSYVSIRQELRQATIESDAKGETPPPVPITVRQLEAIVRLAEAIAKMSLSAVANEHHVLEALRLFRVSTMDAANSEALPVVDGILRPEVLAEVQRVEAMIKRRLFVGSTMSERRMLDEILKSSITEFAARKAIQIMIQRGELEYRKQRHLICRVR